MSILHVVGAAILTRTQLTAVITDICYMALFFGVWYCSYCGFEVCTPCYSAMVPAQERSRSLSPCPKAHAQTWVFPVSYFTEQQIQGILVDLKETMRTITMPISSSHAIPDRVQSPSEEDEDIGNRHHVIPRYKSSELTEEIFVRLWNEHAPFIVSETAELSTTPSQLFDLAKNDECTFEHFDGFLWHDTKTTIGAYFQEWLQEHAWPRHLKVNRIFAFQFPNILFRCFRFIQTQIQKSLKNLSVFCKGCPLNIFRHKAL